MADNDEEGERVTADTVDDLSDLPSELLAELRGPPRQIRHNKEPTRAQLRALEAENRTWPLVLRQIPREQWPSDIELSMHKPPVEAWRSRSFLVQVFEEPEGIVRLSVCRTSHTGRSWEQNITWDELQRLKAECGRGDRMAVEVFPPDGDVVNVANMRHLWVLTEPLPLARRKR